MRDSENQHAASTKRPASMLALAGGCILPVAIAFLAVELAFGHTTWLIPFWHRPSTFLILLFGTILIALATRTHSHLWVSAAHATMFGAAYFHTQYLVPQVAYPRISPAHIELVMLAFDLSVAAVFAQCVVFRRLSRPPEGTA